MQNVINWFEIPVTNLERARSLYEAMLATQLQPMDWEGVPHAFLSNGDPTAPGGALVADPKRPPKRGSGTVIYLNAPNGVARCLERASAAGAKVIQPRTEIGPHGAIGLIEDFDGNVIGLHEAPGAA